MCLSEITSADSLSHDLRSHSTSFMDGDSYRSNTKSIRFGEYAHNFLKTYSAMSPNNRGRSPTCLRETFHQQYNNLCVMVGHLFLKVLLMNLSLLSVSCHRYGLNIMVLEITGNP